MDSELKEEAVQLADEIRKNTIALTALVDRQAIALKKFRKDKLYKYLDFDTYEDFEKNLFSNIKREE